MGRLDGRLVGFARSLREHGIVAGTGEVVDAGQVMTTLGLTDRERLREGLACALVRREGQRAVFDEVFDVWFPAAVGRRTALVGIGADDPLDAAPATREEREATVRALREELSRALAAGDRAGLDRLAARVVEQLGRLPNEATTGSYSALPALDALAPNTAIATAHDQRARSGGAGRAPGDGAGGGQGSYADRFTRDELRSEVAEFRRRVETETRRRNAEARGAERISRYAVRPAADQQLFTLSARTDVQELRRTIAPLARKLGTRLAARRRRADRGTIDVRRTLRSSMSTGGIPVRPAYVARRHGRPDLIVLADLSSSVSGFSRFTILLMQALAAQFRRVRVFGFVNVVDELTDDVVGAPPGSDLSDAFDDLSRVTRWHRSSDYGRALEDFATRYPDAVGHRTTLLVLGDARTNGTDPAYDILRDLAARARHVVWLNPEPARTWGSGDSVAHRYAEIVDMHECRTVAQLRLFVDRTMPV